METSAVSGMRVTIVHKPNPKAATRLKSICTISPCEYWHPPECQFFETESGCKAGDKCLFPHHKVDEKPNKKPKKTYNSPKRRENVDKNAVAIVKFVPQLGCASPDATSLFTNSTSTVHTVYATSSMYPGKQRTVARKSTTQNSSSAKSLRYEIWGQISRRDWKTTAMSQNIYKLKEKRRLQSVRPRKNGYCRLHQ